MKKLKILVVLFGFLGLSQTVCAGDKVAVIVNSANTQSLSVTDIKDIYSDKVTQWANGKKISSYNLPVEAPVREVFSKKVLGLSAQGAAAEESNRKISNTAKNPAKTKRERLVASIVSKNPAAIGYVPHALAEGKSGIRVVMTLE